MPIIDTLILFLYLFSTASNVVSATPADDGSSSAPTEPCNQTSHITKPATGHYQAVNGRLRPRQGQFQVQPQLGASSGNGREVQAIPNKDELIYTIPTVIGDQQLMVQLDTGSADLYVLGPEISRDKTRGRTTFRSRVFRPLQDVTFRLEYQGGDWATGYSGMSQVGIGGVLLPNEMINVATDVRNPQLADGLIGMSVGRVLVEGQTPEPNEFLEHLMQSLERPVFAANLRPGAPSSYQFGFFNREKFRKGQNAIVRVDPSQGQWQFESPGVIVGNRRIQGPMPSLVDTGSSLLRLQERVVNAYYAQVPGAYIHQAAGGYVIPCNAQLPELKIMLTDSYTANIPTNLIMGPRLIEKGDYCLGGLQFEVDNVQSFGVVFLKSHYTVFDRGNYLLGFAPHE